MLLSPMALVNAGEACASTSNGCLPAAAHDAVIQHPAAAVVDAQVQVIQHPPSGVLPRTVAVHGTACHQLSGPICSPSPLHLQNGTPYKLAILGPPVSQSAQSWHVVAR